MRGVSGNRYPYRDPDIQELGSIGLGHSESANHVEFLSERLYTLRIKATRKKNFHMTLPCPTPQLIENSLNPLCYNTFGSGRGAAWLARLLGVQEVPGSNPGGPTKFLKHLQAPNPKGPRQLGPNWVQTQTHSPRYPWYPWVACRVVLSIARRRQHEFSLYMRNRPSPP